MARLRQMYLMKNKLFGAASALFGVGATIVLFTRASSLALAILLGIFAAGSMRARLPLADRPVWGPIAFGVAAGKGLSRDEFWKAVRRRRTKRKI